MDKKEQNRLIEKLKDIKLNYPNIFNWIRDRANSECRIGILILQDFEENINKEILDEKNKFN